MWAIPSSGFGHAADEQPLPYIRYKGKSLSPRFGGDESLSMAGYDSLPLPRFNLINGWPLSQQFFNLRRRRVNIYWRNIFKNPCNKDGAFLFAEQLNYRATADGFVGVCPLVKHLRRFKVEGNRIGVFDEIRFQKSLCFEQFFPFTLLGDNDYLSCSSSFKKSELTLLSISSSVGQCSMQRVASSLTRVLRGDKVCSSASYEVIDELA